MLALGTTHAGLALSVVVFSISVFFAAGRRPIGVGGFIRLGDR